MQELTQNRTNKQTNKIMQKRQISANRKRGRAFQDPCPEFIKWNLNQLSAALSLRFIWCAEVVTDSDTDNE